MGNLLRVAEGKVVARENKSRKNDVSAAEAFEIYYSLGQKRKHKDVAKQMCVSLSTIQLWSSSFGWQDQIDERDKLIIKQLEKVTFEKVCLSKQKQIQMLTNMINDVFEETEDGEIIPKIKIVNIDGLEKAIKLLNLQTGGDTERSGPSSGPIQLIIKNSIGSSI